jgi:hypothetical protein
MTAIAIQRSVTRAPARGVVASAGAVYVLAWIVGLLVAPAAPSPTASDATVATFFSDNHAAILAQATLVHGIAGVALAVFAVALARGTSRPTRLIVSAGVAAAAVSLIQFAMEVVLNRHVADHGSASATASLFHAVNHADTIKLVLLAVMIVAATRLMRGIPRWLGTLGMALGPILVIGGLAFVIDSGALGAVLELSLVLLLLWVAAVSVLTYRGRARLRR